jgi:hypothetical protein
VSLKAVQFDQLLLHKMAAGGLKMAAPSGTENDDTAVATAALMRSVCSTYRLLQRCNRGE